MMANNLAVKASLAQFKAEYLPKIEDQLAHLFDGQEIPDKLKEAMSYSLLAGGKRIRPLLTLLVFDAFKINFDQETIKIACAVELVHTYSLIHDDLPAMDNDDLRRGKPTNHRIYGEALAILAGDALLTHAFDLLSSAGEVELARALAKASGASGMVAGQVLDLEATGKTVGLEQLQLIHQHKTGALLIYAVYAGYFMSWLKLGGCSNQELNQFLEHNLADYAGNFGLAFQIRDDLFDATLTTEELGKTAGKDQAQKKSTYVQLFGVEKSKEYLHLTIEDALNALEKISQKMTFANQEFDSTLLQELVCSLEVK